MGKQQDTFLASSLSFGDSKLYEHEAVRDPVFRQNKFLSSAKEDYVPLLTNNGHKPEEFQAILQLPLVAIGNETMGVERGFWTMREGIHASIETGITHDRLRDVTYFCVTGDWTSSSLSLHLILRKEEQKH
jgi:hypothetical protein